MKAISVVEPWSWTKKCLWAINRILPFFARDLINLNSFNISNNLAQIFFTICSNISLLPNLSMTWWQVVCLCVSLSVTFSTREYLAALAPVGRKGQKELGVKRLKAAQTPGSANICLISKYFFRILDLGN